MSLRHFVANAQRRRSPEEANLNTSIVRFASAWLVLVVTMASRLGGHQALGKPSAADGIYTETQAKRGSAIYDQECVTCHGAALVGSEFGPTLVGDEFVEYWSALTVGDLLESTRRMPKDSPGRLNQQQYADLIAHLLSANGYPSGKKELEPASEVLNEIRIDKPKQLRKR
jgi:mono/diheme cytochrome c family protein